MKILLLIFFTTLAISVNLQAQKVCAKFSPLSLADPITPTLQIGMEYRFLKHWAAEINYGLRTRTNPLPYENNPRMQYYKIKSEVKFYFPRKKINLWYVGFSYQYIPVSHDNLNDSYYTNNSDFSYDRAHISHYASVFSLKAGHLKQITKALSVDFFGGVGLREVNIKHSNFSGLKANPDAMNEGPNIGGDYYDGTFTRLHVELGLKIGFNIIRK